MKRSIIEVTDKNLHRAVMPDPKSRHRPRIILVRELEQEGIFKFCGSLKDATPDEIDVMYSRPAEGELHPPCKKLGDKYRPIWILDWEGKK